MPQETKNDNTINTFEEEMEQLAILFMSLSLESKTAKTPTPPIEIPQQNIITV